MLASERSPLASKRRPTWLATAIGIGIFLVLALVGFTLIAFLAPKAPVKQTSAPTTAVSRAIVIRELSTGYVPWLTSAA